MAFRDYVRRGGVKDASFISKAIPAVSKDVGEPSQFVKADDAGACEVNSRALIVQEVPENEAIVVEEYHLSETKASGIGSRVSGRKRKPPTKVPSAQLKKGRGPGTCSKAPKDSLSEESGDNAPVETGEGLFANCPDPEACNKMMAATAPRGWLKRLHYVPVSALMDVQSQLSLQMAIVDNVANAKSREMQHDLTKVLSRVEELTTRLEAKEEEVKVVRAQLEKGVEASPAMIAAKAQIQKLTEGINSQTEEMIRLRKHSEEQDGKISLLDEQLATACRNNVDLQEQIEAGVKKCTRLITEVLPHACMSLFHSAELGKLLGEFINANRAEERALVLEELAAVGKVVLADREDYLKDASHLTEVTAEAMASAKFPFVAAISADPSASVEELLALKPESPGAP